MLDDIEGFEAEDGEAVIWFLGGAGVAIKTRRALVYVDPYFGGSPSREWLRLTAIPVDPSEVRVATAVLSTHEHTDHCHRGTVVPILRNTGAVFIGSSSSVERVRRWLGEEEAKRKIVEVEPGSALELEDVRVRVFGSRDLYAESAVTYLFETPGGGVFHSGDSSYFTGLKEIGDSHSVHVALLSLGRNFRGRDDYMTPCDLIRAAIDLKAKVVVPIHYDLWKRTREDPRLVKLVAEAWEAEVDVRILSLGDSLRLRGGRIVEVRHI